MGRDAARPDFEAHGSSVGNGNGNSNGNKLPWWLAGILATILVAGLPNYVMLLTQTPNRAEFHEVQLRQESTNEKLAILNARINTLVERQSIQQAQLNAVLSQLANTGGR